jgi:hypothetical protein
MMWFYGLGAWLVLQPVIGVVVGKVIQQGGRR